MLLSLLLNAPLSPSSINVLPSQSCLSNERGTCAVPFLYRKSPGAKFLNYYRKPQTSRHHYQRPAATVPEQSHRTDLHRIAAEILGISIIPTPEILGISAIPTPTYYYISLHITHTPCPTQNTTLHTRHVPYHTALRPNNNTPSPTYHIQHRQTPPLI